MDNLHLQLRVNGEVRRDSNTRNFVFKVPQVVSYLLDILTLEPGDVISIGTPGGVGWKRMPPLWLKPGDLVEAEIQNIGVLRNTIATEAWRPRSGLVWVGRGSLVDMAPSLRAVLGRAL